MLVLLLEELTVLEIKLLKNKFLHTSKEARMLQF